MLGCTSTAVAVAALGLRECGQQNTIASEKQPASCASSRTDAAEQCAAVMSAKTNESPQTPVTGARRSTQGHVSARVAQTEPLEAGIGMGPLERDPERRNARRAPTSASSKHQKPRQRGEDAHLHCFREAEENEQQPGGRVADARVMRERPLDPVAEPEPVGDARRRSQGRSARRARRVSRAQAISSGVSATGASQTTLKRGNRSTSSAARQQRQTVCQRRPMGVKPAKPARSPGRPCRNCAPGGR